MQVEATDGLDKFCKLAFSRFVYNVIGGSVFMNNYFSMTFEADERCVIKQLPTGSTFLNLWRVLSSFAVDGIHEVVQDSSESFEY